MDHTNLVTEVFFLNLYRPFHNTHLSNAPVSFSALKSSEKTFPSTGRQVKRGPGGMSLKLYNTIRKCEKNKNSNKRKTTSTLRKLFISAYNDAAIFSAAEEKMLNFQRSSIERDSKHRLFDSY